MKKKQKLILSLLGGVLFIALFVPNNPYHKESSLFYITKGESNKEIAFDLQKQGIISSAFTFRLITIATLTSHKLQAGIYRLSPAMSPFFIIKTIAKGDIAKETLTIPEGWNIRDIAQYFESKGMFQTEELFKIAGFPGNDYRKSTDFPKLKDYSLQFLALKDKPLYVGLEGYLFPDTYHIKVGETLDQILQTIFTNTQTKLKPFAEEITLQNKTIFEVLTTASLLEKEVRGLHDKKIVAGIIQKRLSVGMPLQIDATVSYLTQKKSTQVSIKETTIDSSYNTYKHTGLPLGPIANPGTESIEAALHPLSTSYWYYLSTPQGQTIFSRTLYEHSAAKTKYLK